MRTRPAAAIAEIAAEVGYAGEAAFSVAFRREVGAPPGAWRKALSLQAGP